MAKEDIGVKIGIDGEKEFKQALKSIDDGLKLTATEMALVTARYSDNAQSVKALTDRGQVLGKQIDEQRSKIAELEKGLLNAQTSFSETDTRTLKWQKDLNLANAELLNLEKAIDNNNLALQDAKSNMEKYGLKEDEVAQQTKSVGGTISDLAGKLGINLPAGADKAIKSLDGAKLSTAALLGVVTGLITGLAKTTIETAKAADEIMTMSKVTGLSTDTIQEMNYASELLDVSTETMTGSMTKMIRTMSDAQKGTGDAADAYRKLHINIKDSNGQLKDSEQVFYETIDALGKVRNETERDALAMEIFGRSARDLNPLIEAGSKSLKELGVEAQKMGYVMDGDALNSLGQLDDAMNKFKNQTDAFKNSIAMIMLPVLTSLFEMLNKIDPKIIATVAIIGTIAAVAVTVAKAIKDVTNTFKALKPVTEVAEAATGAFNYKAMQTTMIVLGVVAALIALAAIIAVISGKSSELNATMSNIGSSVGNMTNTVNGARYNPQYAYVNGSHASGLNYVPYDGYVAELHKGERVQRASENPYNGGRGGGDININVKMSEVDEVYKLVNVAKRSRQVLRAGEVMA